MAIILGGLHVGSMYSTITVNTKELAYQSALTRIVLLADNWKSQHQPGLDSEPPSVHNP